MPGSSDWNPGQYLAFADPRTQPSIDLVNRITSFLSPALIADIGCGPGTSGLVLKRRWPESRIVGIDNSPAMIETAQREYPDGEWVLSDVMDFNFDGKFDLIFSNAAIQWIPRHEDLFEKFFALLSAEGIIAVQLPEFQKSALGKIIDAASRKPRWRRAMEGCSGNFTIRDAGFYYDLLSAGMKKVDLWATEYFQVMPSHENILDWIRSTGLRPYLARLPEEKDKAEFESRILAEIGTQFPRQADGRVLFSTPRLFFIGYR